MSVFDDIIESFSPYAVREEAISGFPASVTLAQIMQESVSHGHLSGLASEANNLFGTKASRDWTGATYTGKTWEEVNGERKQVTATFRAYDSIGDSIRDHTAFLQKYSRYNNLWDNANPFEIATELEQDKYATDSLYAENLIDKINKYDLTRFDATDGKDPSTGKPFTVPKDNPFLKAVKTGWDAVHMSKDEFDATSKKTKELTDNIKNMDWSATLTDLAQGAGKIAVYLILFIVFVGVLILAVKG